MVEAFDNDSDVPSNLLVPALAITPLLRTASLWTKTTDSSFSTVWGPGARTGKVLKAFGEGVKNGVLILTVNTWLSKKMTLAKNLSRLEALADGEFLSLCMELAELTRKYWGKSIRSSAIRLVQRILLEPKSSFSSFQTLKILVGYGLFKDLYAGLNDLAYGVNERIISIIEKSLPSRDACHLMIQYLDFWLRHPHEIYSPPTSYVFPPSDGPEISATLLEAGIVQLLHSGLMSLEPAYISALRGLFDMGLAWGHEIKMFFSQQLCQVPMGQSFRAQDMRAQDTFSILVKLAIDPSDDLLAGLDNSQIRRMLWEWTFNHMLDDESITWEALLVLSRMSRAITPGMVTLPSDESVSLFYAICQGYRSWEFISYRRHEIQRACLYLVLLSGTQINHPELIPGLLPMLQIPIQDLKNGFSAQRSILAIIALAQSSSQPWAIAHLAAADLIHLFEKVTLILETTMTSKEPQIELIRSAAKREIKFAMENLSNYKNEGVPPQ